MKRGVGRKTDSYRMFSRVLFALLLLVLFAIPFDTVKAETVSSDEDFVIEDGVLIKYKGSASKVIVPEGVTTISGTNFNDYNGLNWNNNIKTLILPDSLKEIGDYAFCRSMYLTKIDIPEGVTTIGEWAFYECKNLQEINFPKSVMYIKGRDSFEKTAWLKEKEAESDLVIVNNVLVSGYNAKGKVTVPEGVTRIADHAMVFSSATKVYLPDSMVEIGEFAFEECRKLKELEVPRNVTEYNSWFIGHMKMPTLLVYKDSPIHKYVKEENEVMNSHFKYRVLDADPADEQYVTVKVQKGDSLWKIAREHLGSGIRYEEIMKLNHLENTVIYVGQKLKLTSTEKMEEPEPVREKFEKQEINVIYYGTFVQKWNMKF